VAYRISEAADRDIEALYIEGALRFGLAQADRYHESLTRAFEAIAAFPELARERDELNPPVRTQPTGSHIVVYRILEDGDVLIIRVRHGREDWVDDLV